MPSPSSLLATMRSQHLRTWRGDIVKAAMPRARICAGLDSTLGLILVVLRPGPTKKQARTARVGYGPGSDIRRFGPSALLRLSGNPRHQRIETHRELAVAFERAEVATDPAERTRLLTFVICGAGPTGVELAGAIADLAHFGLSDEFRSIDPSSARIVLVQAGPRVLPTFPEGLSLAAQTSLEKMGIEVRLNSRVEKVEAGRVIVNGEAIPAGTVLWAAGVVASPAARWLGHEPDSAGRLKVSPDLSVPGHPEIFGVGDTVSVAAWNGRPAPGLAPAAKQAGAYVAEVLCARIYGDPPRPLFRYRHWGSLATLGRKSAVVDLGRITLSGVVAWWFWGTVHLLLVVGLRNRASVLLGWIWSYATYQVGVQLITGLTVAKAAARRSAKSPPTDT
jgi:NADH dehydrogenase FAD-containing subunit